VIKLKFNTFFLNKGMGCTHSVKSKYSSKKKTDVTRNNPSIKREWKIIPDMKQQAAQFKADRTLKANNSNPDYIELRSILGDPIGQRYLGRYAKEIYTTELFFGWIDIQEYKTIPTADYRRGKALHIYEKYIKAGSVLELGVLSLEDRTLTKELLDNGKKNRNLLTPEIFDDVQHKCFVDMYHNIFVRFKATEYYPQMKERMRSTYNRVTVSDFDYIEKLGEGGFGRVIHVRKISTQKHYAMKIQLKTALLDTFADDPSRLDAERTVFAACSHPYIVEMDYAFQTPAHAILVLGLVTAGDLQTAIDESKHNRLSESRVRFYTAEIVLALSHLHDLGLMYRDLKPCNIMLHQDGHSKLADMGGVAEFAENTVLNGHNFTNDGGMANLYGQSMAPMKVPGQKERYHKHFDPNRRHTRSQGEGSDEDEPTIGRQHRRKSIMGTYGYMAPEMVRLMGQPRSERIGYTKAVDFWSLGVTVYKLLTGTRPFKRHAYQQYVEAGTMRLPDGSRECELLLRNINFPSYISQTAKGFILRLLDASEKTRLGTDRHGLDGLKAHPFFSGIDWEKLSQKHVIPPYQPPVKTLNEKPRFSNYESMMNLLNEEEAADASNPDKFDWTVIPNREDQVYFDKWDFISPLTLKIEMGIAQEMEVYDTNFKVRQIMGADEELMNGGTFDPKGGKNLRKLVMSPSKSKTTLPTNNNSSF